jgi:hypothetical protein
MLSFISMPIIIIIPSFKWIPLIVFDWDQVCIPLNIAAMTDVELSFIAVRGNGPIGDIGLDDVIVNM